MGGGARNEGAHVGMSSFFWYTCCEKRFLVAVDLLRLVDFTTVFSVLCARGLVFSVGVAVRVGVRRYWIDLASMASAYMAWPKCPDLYPPTHNVCPGQMPMTMQSSSRVFPPGVSGTLFNTKARVCYGWVARVLEDKHQHGRSTRIRVFYKAMDDE